MKVAHFTLLTFVCIAIISNKANAQIGYIVTSKNDTLKGELKISAFGRPKFKQANKANFIPVNFDTLKEYQLIKDSSVWVAKILPQTTMNLVSKPQFVQWLERGTINLYQQVGTDRYQLRTWYVTKTTDSMLAIKTDDVFLGGGGSKNGRKAILSDMFADQPTVKSVFNATGKFDFGTIRAYIQRYNKAALSSAK